MIQFWVRAFILVFPLESEVNFTSLLTRDTKEPSQRGKYRVAQTPLRVILLWFPGCFGKGSIPDRQES